MSNEVQKKSFQRAVTSSRVNINANSFSEICLNEESKIVR